jgi:hypothetical protein
MTHMLGVMPNLDRDKLLKDCLDMAQREAANVARRSVVGAVKALVAASATGATGVERARFSDAADSLHRAITAIAESFPKFLREEIILPGASSPGGKAFSFDSLELMAEDQVDDTVELVRGQQAVQAIVEPELVQLNALVSGLQGYEEVKAESNPLRPELWVKALHRSLGRGGASASARALWMQSLCPAFGPELAALYRLICDHILKQGVAAAAYKVSAPKHETRRRVEAARLTLRDLKKLLVSATLNEGDTQGLSRPAGQTLNGMTMPAAMVALEGMNKLDDVVRRMQERWRSGIWHAEKTDGKTQEAGVEYTPTQTLAREVLHQMVDNIVSDPRLLPDVQHLIRKLEPTLMQLVMHDQRFFTDKRHPARALLEEVTQRSLAWPRESTAGFNEFFAPLHEALDLLAGMSVQDAEPFEFTLHTLRQSWGEAEERARRQRASVAKALIKADARNHAAATVAARLRDRFDVASAPPEVRRFLLGPWSQVIASAQLGEPTAPDPGGYEALVGDIVWSAQPRLAAQDLARLHDISGSLAGAMRRALTGIGISGKEVEPFLATLTTAHAKAMRGETSDDAGSARHAQEQMIDWDADALPWLTPEEVQDSMMMQATDFASTQHDTRSHHGGNAAVTEIASGDYIEVMVRGAWARWKLAWTSPHGTMMMFTDAGGRPESVTRVTLAKMFDAGNARRIAGGSVVDSALNPVAQAALVNSSQESSSQSPM